MLLDTTYLFHRAHFLDVFISHLPKHSAHLGKRLKTYTQDGSGKPIELFFADGSTATCDVLVGCDGIKSAVRPRMLSDLAAKGESKVLRYTRDPFWSGSVTYRALIPSEKLSRWHSTLREPMMVSYPFLSCITFMLINVIVLWRKQGTCLSSIGHVYSYALVDST